MARDKQVRGQDGWRLRYGLAAAAALLLLAYTQELDRVLSPELLLLPAVGLPLLGVAAFLLRAIGGNVRRGRARAAVSAVLGPVAALCLFWALAQAGVGPAWLRFMAYRGWYEQQVRALPPEAGGMALWRWGTIHWGSGGWRDGTTDWALVYDGSDGLALPPDRWDPAWVPRMGLLVTDGDSAGQEALRHAQFRRLQGHFFLMTEVN